VSIELFLGIDTGGTGIKYVVTGRDGVPLVRGEVATDPSSIAKSMIRLKEAVDTSLETIATGAGLQSVGVACAGIVDVAAGRLGRSPNLPGWQDSDLRGGVAAVFGGLPVTVANDVNGGLYGEFKHGAGRGCSNLVMIALGTGVGGGIIIDGRLVLGSHAGAGEIGHMVLDPAGPVCTCGGRGCLEAWAGSPGLLNLARGEVRAGNGGAALAELILSSGDSLTTRDLAKLASAGDAGARELFAIAGRRLGQAVGNLVNVLDPDRVIVGGGVAQAGDLILGPCREVVPQLVLAVEAKNVPVVPAELGTLAAAIGAASLAREMEHTG
jgi:glucokinase